MIGGSVVDHNISKDSRQNVWYIAIELKLAQQ